MQKKPAANVCADLDPVSASPSAFHSDFYVLRIQRKRASFAHLLNLQCYVDGTLAATVANGQEVSVRLFSPVIEFKCKYGYNFFSDPVYIDLRSSEFATVYVSLPFRPSGKPKVLVRFGREVTAAQWQDVRSGVSAYQGDLIDVPLKAVPANAQPNLNDKNPLDIIRDMESRFAEMYKLAYEQMLNADDCKRAYHSLEKTFDRSTLR